MMNKYEEFNLLETIVFLWKNHRKGVIVFIMTLTIVRGVSSIVTVVQSSGSFSSANLDRIERGIYQLRVETFGVRANDIREDTFVDFDRDLYITFREVGNVLAFRVQNLNEEIVIDGIRINGRLGDGNSVRQIDVSHDNMNLSYNQESWDIAVDGGNLREMHEFINYLELEFVEIIFQFLENGELIPGLITIRYDVRYDRYRIMEDLREIVEQNDVEDTDNDEIDLEDGDMFEIDQDRVNDIDVTVSGSEESPPLELDPVPSLPSAHPDPTLPLVDPVPPSPVDPVPPLPVEPVPPLPVDPVPPPPVEPVPPPVEPDLVEPPPVEPVPPPIEPDLVEPPEGESDD